MKHHLTERDIIEYRFRLTSERQVSRSVRHLASCAECRERLRQLNRKFAALDLLREEVEASEGLISQVVEQASQPVARRVFSFRTPAWIGSAAAALVVGLLLLVAHVNNQDKPTGEVVRVPGLGEEASYTEIKALGERAAGLETRTVAKRSDEGVGLPLAEDLIVKDIRMRGPAADVPKEEAREQEYFHAAVTVGGAGSVPPEEISEQPPFAPASAIELVVLPRRDSVQITIYNSADLTLVRERRNLTLKRGWNWLQFMWANTLIDPTSLSLEPLEQKDKIDIQQLVFPARLRELGRWLIRSEVSGRVPFEITYFTSGLSWRAFYMGTLSQDEKKMRLDGYVRVGNNSGEDYEKAQTRLIVGTVHILDEIAELARQQYPYGRPVPFVGSGAGEHGGFGGFKGQVTTNGRFRSWYRAFDAEGITDKPKEIKKEGLSEYFLYTIEGTETIADKWGKRLLSFEAEDIPVKSLYKYDEQRWGEQTIRFVSFANDEEHELGDTPIPNGTMRIYGQADEQGYLSYVGGTDIKYIPVDEEVELNLGPARLVEVGLVLMDFKTDNYVFDKKKNITGWDEIRTWKMEVTNTCTLPIEIEITRGFGTAYWTLQAEIPYEKHDATHARFKLQVEPRRKRAFEYTIRTYHGTREDVLTK